ncbi:isoprenylcysteine carboxyl methyltransferase [Colletotrichum tofieldiae]|uniref:Protein-S-isoprenylcysteine O-methyltransferase n=1 Tax=Colletotrichum tofieldiae TaxID=708197 RepID=A0A161VKH9_9PEZI|nr:isoprenylcysteine carboxyl methyltransferase [Colletotrichum tofieldiae]GKT52843.1 isoprenylcysteine carboxyl methyltransferase [Colletotrichum tofieldiae]GKT80759.1 isoprenylcysteine carboxyl methyltransferase [Colletotrichum tofieldiae]GKT88889.1 isoprenylcysteine carboxyl methyltransferase [Colletotrichum tofieldiae]
MSPSQLSLAFAILASTAGTYAGLRNPNPEPPQKPGDSEPPQRPRHADSIRWMNLTHRHTPKVILLPLVFLSLHLAALAFYYPDIPPAVLRHGAENGLSAPLTTWSCSTFLPLALIFVAGIPLRLGPYRALGKNFTFQLSKPDQLKTTGIYAYVQHPSYTGVMVLVLSNVALLARLDGVLSCWVPPTMHRSLRAVEWVLGPAACSVFLFGVWTRVREEERMLRAEFGEKWERWHASTARFIPHVF